MKRCARNFHDPRWLASIDLQFVPGIGGALAVTFVTAVTWRLNQRREEWLTALAQGVEDLRQQLGDIDLDTLVSDGGSRTRSCCARTVEHTHQKDKLDAVLNSVGPNAPDADTQSIFMNMVDRFTPSHLRMLALWDDPPAWFASHSLPRLTSSGNRARTVEATLPEMHGRGQLIALIASELKTAQLLTADMVGMVSDQGMMQRLTTDFGRQLVRFISPPRRLVQFCHVGGLVLVASAISEIFADGIGRAHAQGSRRLGSRYRILRRSRCRMA